MIKYTHGQYSKKVCQAMLHLLNTPIYNPFNVFSDEKFTEWTNAGNIGKKGIYEKAVIANLEEMAKKGWTNSLKFCKQYSRKGRENFEYSPLSL